MIKKDIKRSKAYMFEFNWSEQDHLDVLKVCKLPKRETKKQRDLDIEYLLKLKRLLP